MTTLERQALVSLVSFAAGVAGALVVSVIHAERESRRSMGILSAAARHFTGGVYGR